MQKFTVLMAMAVFLASTLFMAVPGFAQAQGGCPSGYKQGNGSVCGGGPGYSTTNPNAQSGSQYGSGCGSGYCYRNKAKNQVRSSNNPDTPVNSQPQSLTPGGSNPATSQPQSQTPGGGTAPRSGN